MQKLREPVSSSLTNDIAMLVRSQLAGRRGLLILAVMTGFAGIALNWSWLVAAGFAPILIAVLPCLVMCGLGLCMNKMMSGSCESPQASGSKKSSPVEPMEFGRNRDDSTTVPDTFRSSRKQSLSDRPTMVVELDDSVSISNATNHKEEQS